MTGSAASAADAERWLLDLENFGIRPGLERMRALVDALGLPPRTTIHLAGTNGKTSTTLLCAAMLRHAGLRAGAYVSPHVVSFADRIHVDGAPLDDATFGTLAAEVRAAVDRLPEGAGQFEALTAIALLAFARADVDVQVLEAGLGGRLDATNAVRSDVQVLTSVGLDHQRWLGDTVEEIALEKLAIVEDGGTLVLAPGLTPIVKVLAHGLAQERSASVVQAHAVREADVRDPHAAGPFQRQNLGVALAAVRAVLSCADVRGAASREPTDEGLIGAGEARLPIRGRLEVLGHDPLVIVDAAHNVQAARALLDAYDGVAGARETVAVVAFLDDKDPTGVLEVLARRCRVVIATTTSNPRALEARAVADAARALGIESEEVPDPVAALGRARTRAGRAGAVLVTGTTSLARELAAPGSAASRSRF